ncbi:glycosyltransferase involved in cell wall biosynthesis [Pseudarthrobacter sp. W1I19]|uniref:glycosyltransferase n=1 Tax=Pseudarthrobacter sp. W1I19 TaxID=3042288 RepID=UPI00278A9832|nr:glycosyltransferase [Pseudarthrobacter sp. W1I19]MDQ0922278.1 glycosyltransferase involved in cell wall biosynthesis [Pseudarthrobacter sp. W1I19]
MTTKGTLHGRIALATNNGDIGGGEVMLLNVAEAMVGLGFDVVVVGPSAPSGLVDLARDRGFSTVVLPARTRLQYVLSLRRWDRRERLGLLWCNGLLPSVSTAARKRRVVHLHQRPVGKLRLLAAMSRWGAIATVVPSADMASAVRGSRVLHNWVHPVVHARRRTLSDVGTGTVRVGFLGRTSTEKGVVVLCGAIRELQRRSGRKFRLVLAGEPRFVDAKSSSVVDDSVAALGDSVERTGWITPAEFFGRVDVLVCPSLWPEPFGLVAAEALSAKVPLVVSDAGALPEVVGRDYPWIAKRGDAVGLANMITLAVDSEESDLQGCFDRWERMFSPQAGRQRLKFLLSEIGYSSPEDVRHA